MVNRIFLLLAILSALILPVTAQDDLVSGVSTGIGTLTQSCSVTTSCSTGERFVAANCGVVTDSNGVEWTVPAEVNTEGALMTSLYDDCNSSGNNPNWESELETVVVDEGGETVTAYVHGDNYAELFVNGEFIGRDNIGFVPFNSNVARFQATYPMTLAVKLVDWEEHFGVGMEYDRFNVGDGGFAAAFSDGTITNGEWKCQTYYIAPLDDLTCVGDNRDTSACSIQPTCATNDPSSCQGLHYEVPADWASTEFDDSGWQDATVWADDIIGPKAAFNNFPNLFGEAQFIWTKNVDTDNAVLCRLTVEAPAQMLPTAETGTQVGASAGGGGNPPSQGGNAGDPPPRPGDNAGDPPPRPGS